VCAVFVPFHRSLPFHLKVVVGEGATTSLAPASSRVVNRIEALHLTPQAEQYVHRIGRTGRAGAKGRSMVFLDEYNAQDRSFAQPLVKASEVLCAAA
jgi:hypothetical protein